MVEALDRASGPYTAAKALALASAIFRHAMTREQIASNPCALIKITDFVGDMAPRQRVLTDAEIGLLWRATEDIYPAGPFARFLLLTAVRRSEAAHMTWGEVNLDDALWVVPASRTKSGVPHEVPLSGMAIDLLRSLPRFTGGDFVFSTTGGRRGIRSFSLYKDAIDARAVRAGRLAFPRSATDRAHQSGVARRLAVHRRADPRPSAKGRPQGLRRSPLSGREARGIGALGQSASRHRHAATRQRQATPGGRRCVIPTTDLVVKELIEIAIQYLCERELLELNDAINANFADQRQFAELTRC